MSGVIFRWSWYYKGRLRLPESWSRAPPGFCIRPRGLYRGFALPLFFPGHGPGSLPGLRATLVSPGARPRAFTGASRYPCFSPGTAQGTYRGIALPLFLPGPLPVLRATLVSSAAHPGERSLSSFPCCQTTDTPHIPFAGFPGAWPCR